MNQKYRPFTSLSRRKRRAKTFEVKNLIYRERYRCGGLFYDDCDMNAAVASGNWRWSDILFLGRDPAVFWNAEIITASEAFNDRVESIAFDEAWSMLDDDERQYDFRYKSAFPPVRWADMDGIYRETRAGNCPRKPTSSSLWLSHPTGLCKWYWFADHR